MPTLVVTTCPAPSMVPLLVPRMTPDTDVLVDCLDEFSLTPTSTNQIIYYYLGQKEPLLS